MLAWKQEDINPFVFEKIGNVFGTEALLSLVTFSVSVDPSMGICELFGTCNTGFSLSWTVYIEGCNTTTSFYCTSLCCALQIISFSST